MSPQQGVFSRAWSLLRRYPWLLLFGVLAGLRLNVSFDSNSFLQGGSWFVQDLLTVRLPDNLILLWTTGVSFGLWLLGLVARAGLIRATVDLDQGQPNTSFVRGWQQGLAALWPVILMQLTIWGPFILIGAIAFFAAPQLTELLTNLQPANPEQALGVMMPMICGALLVLLPLVFVLSVVEAFAYRAIVLNQLQPWAAIRRGWQVMQDGLGEIINTGIGITLLGFVYSLVIAAPFFALLLPVMLSWSSVAFRECAAYTGQPAFSACVSNTFAGDGLMSLGVLLLGLVSALLGSVWVTYQSAVFTLLYARLTGTPATFVTQATSG